jgi:hypothetical protein
MVATLNTTSVPSPSSANLGEYKFLTAGNVICIVKAYAVYVKKLTLSAQYVIYFSRFSVSSLLFCSCFNVTRSSPRFYFKIGMYGKQQTSDQFRAFFPASRAVNAPVTLERVAREQAQRPPPSSYSYTQSQDRSQTTTSQHESQLSPPRYEELLASGRHLEIKDTLAALGRTISTLSQNVGAMQTAMSTQESKLGGIQESLRQMNEAQARQEQSMAQLLKVVEELREERLSPASSSSFETSGTEDCAEPVSPLSDAGMSVSEYLKVKRLRIKDSPPNGIKQESVTG